MRTLLELRVNERYASRVFRPDEGRLLGPPGFQSVRRILLSLPDPRMEQIATIQRELGANGEFLFAGWHYHRRYSKAELATAQAFQLVSLPTFEPAGEEFGTTYEAATACPVCGAGRRQSSPLRLPRSRMPRKALIARTIAGEMVVTAPFAAVIRTAHLAGLSLHEVEPPTRQRQLARSALPWFQLSFTGRKLELASSTVCGIDPVDLDQGGQYRCPVGCTVGLNLLSEATLCAPGLAEDDVGSSRQFVGVRRGLLTPEPLYFVSPRVRQLLLAHGLASRHFEVAPVENLVPAT